MKQWSPPLAELIRVLLLFLVSLTMGSGLSSQGHVGSGLGQTTAQTSGPAGWSEIPNSKLQDFCPPNTDAYKFSSFCRGVIRAWSGGIADTTRNRLLIWGGGHNDYAGNEIYAVDLNTGKMSRLNDPSPVTLCQQATSDSKANSRHTYGGLAYIAHADRMFVYGGSLACSTGNASNDTWTLNLATLQWQRMDPVRGGAPDYAYGVVAAYDENSRLVFLDDRKSFWSYDFDSNTYRKLISNTGTGLHTNAVIDPKRKLFLTLGDGSIRSISIASGGSHGVKTLATTNCKEVLEANAPGLAYDAQLDRIVAWPGFGDSVYLFDPDTRSCVSQTYKGGPPDSAHAGNPHSTNGTFGRFQYFPARGIFAVVNDADRNAYTLQLAGVDPIGTPAPLTRPTEPRPTTVSPLPAKSVPLNSVEAQTALPPMDFPSRCKVHGVVRCFGFDNANLVRAHLDPDSDGLIRGEVDRDVKASGTGSLRFVIPPFSSANSSGQFSLNFSDDHSVQFGAGDDFYVQWRQRFSPEMITTQYEGGNGWKQVIIGEGDRPGHKAFSCTEIELVLENSYQRGAPQMYHSCGGKDGKYEPIQAFDQPHQKWLIQNAVNCPHDPVTSPPCVLYKPDQWMTFQIHVHIGSWYQNDRNYRHDSTVQLWVAEEGKPSMLVMDANPANGTGLDLVNTSPANAKFGKIWLLPYDTNKSNKQNHPAAYTWYDELIISRERIPDPL